ncbi:hypothetical protein VP01_2955g5 [Puccinia sorghi]|uniref:Uncharacterized protein n=1 Tax=Puccinia sorghi TaxID=27349 RepID=A0A0L6V0W1_9BASI|nr:hypothetical protein VP01_2955g5 [Puccinia sorghi]
MKDQRRGTKPGEGNKNSGDRMKGYQSTPTKEGDGDTVLHRLFLSSFGESLSKKKPDPQEHHSALKCGNQILESGKGIFLSSTSTVAQFLRGYYLQINSRCNADFKPSYILKRVADSKLEASQERDSCSLGLCPGKSLGVGVFIYFLSQGTNYKPIGRSEISFMTRKQKPTPPAPVGTFYTSLKTWASFRHSMNDGNFDPTTRLLLPHPSLTPVNNGDCCPSYIVGPTPSIALASTCRPKLMLSLGKPGKLGNRILAFSTPQEFNPAVSATSGGKKLTWDECQALEKSVAAEEEVPSQAAIERSNSLVNWMPSIVLEHVPPPSPSCATPAEYDELATPAALEADSEDDDFKPSAAQPPSLPYPPPPLPPALPHHRQQPLWSQLWTILQHHHSCHRPLLAQNFLLYPPQWMLYNM